MRLSSSSSQAQVGEPFEVRVDLSRGYSNPFDPDEIAVDARIETPSGRVEVLPGFWTQAVSRSLVDNREVLKCQGDGYFAVRYAPTEPGLHRLTISAQDSSGQGLSSPLSFEASSTSNPGYIRLDPQDPFALAFDDGSAYVPVGANLDWSSEPSAGYDMEAYLQSLQDAGLNWTRLWMTHFGQGWTLEWGATHPSGYYHGLGIYSLEVASRLDNFFEQAQKRHIAVQLVLWQHSQLDADNWTSWNENPYNAANGGPAKTSAEFFSDPLALSLSKRRVRYLVARYSAYRSLLAWEIMNEMDGVKAPFTQVSSWCEDRARDIRKLDPYQHLVTTSQMIRPSIAPLPALASDAYDITQNHVYGTDIGPWLKRDAEALRTFGKPFILGEFGLDFTGALDLTDPKGYHLTEASWVALASGYSGGAMSWWWDSYLRPNQLWKTQTPIAKVAQAVDLRGLHEPLLEGTEASSGGENLTLFGRQGIKGAFLYIRHPSAAWEAACTQAPQNISAAKLTIPGKPAKPAQMWAFDSQSGELIQAWQASADPSGMLTTGLPPFAGSVVVHLKWTEPPAAVHSDPGGGCSVGRGAKRQGAWGSAIAALLALIRLANSKLHRKRIS